MYLGTVARCAQLVWIQAGPPTDCIYRVPTSVDGFYITSRPQVQQSANHQVHVLLDFAYLSYATSNDRWNNTSVSSHASHPDTLLVRMGSVSHVKWAASVRAYQSKR